MSIAGRFTVVALYTVSLTQLLTLLSVGVHVVIADHQFAAGSYLILGEPRNHIQSDENPTYAALYRTNWQPLVYHQPQELDSQRGQPSTAGVETERVGGGSGIPHYFFYSNADADETDLSAASSGMIQQQNVADASQTASVPSAGTQQQLIIASFSPSAAVVETSNELYSPALSVDDGRLNVFPFPPTSSSASRGTFSSVVAGNQLMTTSHRHVMQAPRRHQAPPPAVAARRTVDITVDPNFEPVDIGSQQKQRQQSREPGAGRTGTGGDPGERGDDEEEDESDTRTQPKRTDSSYDDDDDDDGDDVIDDVRFRDNDVDDDVGELIGGAKKKSSLKDLFDIDDESTADYELDPGAAGASMRAAKSVYYGSRPKMIKPKVIIVKKITPVSTTTAFRG